MFRRAETWVCLQTSFRYDKQYCFYSVMRVVLSADIGTPEQHHTYIIPMNHTVKSKESMLSYFTEDVGLNTFNRYYRMIYPSWFNVTEYGHKIDRRGEMFLYVQHQLFARYCIERWSNGMPDVEAFVYNKPLKVMVSAKLQHLD
jgi:hypothetical protein